MHTKAEWTQGTHIQAQSGPRDRADLGTADGGTEQTPGRPTYRESGLRDRRPRDRAEPEIAHLQTEYTQGQSKPRTADSETADLEREQPDVLGTQDECGIRDSSPRTKQTQGWSRLRAAYQDRANTVRTDPGEQRTHGQGTQRQHGPRDKMHQGTGRT